MLKKLIPLALLLLTSCAGAPVNNTHMIHTPPLNLPASKPLALKPVVFKVIIINKTPQYCVSGTGYSNLSNNMEKIQDRLDVDHQIIKKSNAYYNGKLNN